MVGEWFPWSKDSYFIYLKQNHNSLLGIREYAVKKGKFRVVKEKHVPKIVEKYTTDTNRNAYHLFAYPAEENFSGGIYPLSWITKIKQQSMQNNANWKVLLDAAAFVPTNPLNVTKYPADAICISFYKMFGYPTGLGAAIIRRDLLEVFKKTFFGGGTVSLTDCNTRYCKFVEGPSKFEDGTLHFLGITAAIHGFKILDQLGMDEVQAHVYSLTRLLYNRLSELKHSNGQPVVRIYGKHHIQHGLQQGGIVSFNLLSSKGYYRRLFKVQSLAAKHNINIRTG
jgi:molybdenum cofactor sulfurtransferase